VGEGAEASLAPPPSSDTPFIRPVIGKETHQHL